MKKSEILEKRVINCVKCCTDKQQLKCKKTSARGNIIYVFTDELGNNWPNRLMCPDCRGKGRRSKITPDYNELGETQAEIDKTVKKYNCKHCGAITTNRFNCTKCLDYLLTGVDINGVDL